MKQAFSDRYLYAAALILAVALHVPAQKRETGLVSERNVRAQMNFLAGDAMQGRGSGTVFERIAAEYIGSQFMQFGLEPAGEPGYDGRPTYVQTVDTYQRGFIGSPTLTIGSLTITHGREMLVNRTGSDKIQGTLQKLALGEKPNANAAVFVTFPAGNVPTNVAQAVQPIIAAGASMVMIEETPQVRNNWSAIAGRRLTYSTAANAPRATAILIVDKATAAAVSRMANGTSVEFAGTPGPLGQTWNAIGKITGTDKKLSPEVILLSSHLDHLGVREEAPGSDKIFNGADDDASGSVAVLELARLLATGKAPKRTVYFVCFGSEESRGLGSAYFSSTMPFPKEMLVANLQFEMIGRPDAKVKPEELWLTGYERSNLGPELARRGAKLVQDPRPDQNFFMRSDNIVLARQGIIAHTVSSFGLHTDYHQTSDELKTIDFTHMTHSINSMVEPIRWLINSDFKPAWREGGRPQ